ncbi:MULTISPECIES: hypothetical protein [unclassified Streptomyces]|uniref:hypothetical protein n=1 Tax=unclassified Streptomyces TaxID=2593676 RepID=UPI00296735E2|nr:hypothetical protein [Streptomyces sp. SJL17-1]
MSHRPNPAPPKALTPLDHRVELAVGFRVGRLWRDHDRGLLDEPAARLATAHRALADAVTAVTFYRVLLQRLSSGEYAIDQALFARLDRTVQQLKQAVVIRDAREQEAVAALELIEAQTSQKPAAPGELKAREVALLLAISQGAKLHEHLLTQRLSVVTGSGARVTQQDYERLERAGLVQRDASRPLHAGQPVTLTDAGRVALTARPAAPASLRPAARPGAWPTAPRTRR